MFDKRKLKEVYETLKIGSDWIRLLEDDLGILRSTLDTLAACCLKENLARFTFYFLLKINVLFLTKYRT